MCCSQYLGMFCMMRESVHVTSLLLLLLWSWCSAPNTQSCSLSETNKVTHLCPAAAQHRIFQQVVTSKEIIGLLFGQSIFLSTVDIVSHHFISMNVQCPPDGSFFSCKCHLCVTCRTLKVHVYITIQPMDCSSVSLF